MTESAMRLKRLFVSAVGGSWGSEPGEGDVDALCIRGTDFDVARMRVDPSRAPVRGFRTIDLARRGAVCGDLIIEKSGGGEQQPVGRVVLWDGSDTVVPTNFAARLQVNPDTNARFATYLLASMWSDGRTRVAINQTTGIQNLDLEALLDQHVSRPAIPIQEAIVDYLDCETARIDELIAAKRRLVELLKERLAIYTREMLMSGSQTLRPLKRTWQVIDCKHRTPTYVDDGYPVISPGDATPGRLDISRAHRFVGQDDYRDLTGGGRRPKMGDIVYSRNASIGIAAYVDTDAPFCMGQDVCLISSEHASQLYLTYFLNSLGLDQLEEQKLGSTFSRVNIAQILDLVVPTPPPDEQHRIAQHLDEATALYGTLVSDIEAQVVLLREKGQALITAAVTGQLDIPEAA